MFDPSSCESLDYIKPLLVCDSQHEVLVVVEFWYDSLYGTALTVVLRVTWAHMVVQ